VNNNLVCIINHNYNDNALLLKTMFSKYLETFIIDSKSDIIEDYFDFKLENVGYSGLFNKSVELCIEKNKDGLLLVCSDVFIKKNQFQKIVEKINIINQNEIGVYSPSSKGQSHAHCKKIKDGFRDVVFVEGFVFYASIDILKEIYPVDLNINKFGYGLDAHKGVLCFKKNKRCVIDDDIEVFHTEGTGYNTNEASAQFINYMNNNVELKKFWEEYVKNNYNSDLMLKKIKNK